MANNTRFALLSKLLLLLIHSCPEDFNSEREPDWTQLNSSLSQLRMSPSAWVIGAGLGQCLTSACSFLSWALSMF